MDKVIKFTDIKKERNIAKMNKENKMLAWLKGEAKKMQKENITPKSAAKFADKILEQMDLSSKGATAIVTLITNLGIHVCAANDLEEGISGIIYANGTTGDFYKSNVAIIANGKDPLEHQRFVLAHELGHYIFDCLGDSAYDDEGLLFHKTYSETDHFSQSEVRADRFAAELLMPKKLFIEQYNRVNTYGNRLLTISYLAKFFKVKPSSIEKRIREVLYDGGY